MKKLFAVLLSAMLLLAMAACGEQSQTPDDTQEPAVLHMATEGTFPPYEYYDNGQLVGIDIEVAGAIAEKLGISEKRVRNLVAGMLDKTGFRSRTELAVRAREAGIVILERQEDDI